MELWSCVMMTVYAEPPAHMNLAFICFVLAHWDILGWREGREGVFAPRNDCISHVAEGMVKTVGGWGKTNLKTKCASNDARLKTMVNTGLALPAFKS